MITIPGPLKLEDNERRGRLNHEIIRELKGDDIITHIKVTRIKWLENIRKAE